MIGFHVGINKWAQYKVFIESKELLGFAICSQATLRPSFSFVWGLIYPSIGTILFIVIVPLVAGIRAYVINVPLWSLQKKILNTVHL